MINTRYPATSPMGMALSLLPTDACVLWSARINANGYGVAWDREASKLWLAHRLVYTLTVGDIPTGLQLDHLCRVRNCVNPAHLEPVTGVENVRRGEYATRTHCIHGHEYTPENTYLRPDSRQGRRDCRACIRARVARYTASKKVADER